MKRFCGRFRKMLLVLVTGGSLFAAGCRTTDVRDAIVGGALAYLKGTSEDVLGIFFPLPEIIEANTGDEADGG